MRFLFGEEHDAAWAGYGALERCFFYGSLSDAVDKLVAYRGSISEVKRDTHDQVESFFVRLRAALAERRRHEPSQVSKGLTRIGSVPDWIEAHPQNIRLLLIVVIVGIQFPQIIAQVTELIRATQGR